jgi:hypothetical protein
MAPFCVGAVARGYVVWRFPNQLLALDDFEQGLQFDLVAIGGGETRHGGENGRIAEFFRHQGVMTVICEKGRLVSDSLMILLGPKPWVPATWRPNDRMTELNLHYKPQPPGDVILVCGQTEEFDRQLEPALCEIKANSKRKIIYRPHPSQNRIPRENRYAPEMVDGISDHCTKVGQESVEDLGRDLARAYCVVTHSSIVAVTATLRGIPVLAAPPCPAYPVCRPLLDGRYIETIMPTGEARMRDFISAFSHTIWREDEVRSGEALSNYEGWFQ